MIQLFLSKPTSDDKGDGDAVKVRISLLQRLESIIWSVITSGGRYEARLWLCNTISCIRSITPRDQHKLFVGLLRSKTSKQDVAAQLLRMIFEKCPQKAGAVLARRCHILEKFFKGNSRRILQWFDHFATTGDVGHKKGARAISQYAFVNRDICWEELEWKGRHGQSPAVVATKPHYFHDLDVPRTVENFLEYVPDFWSSEELAESVRDGEILHMDTQFFVDQFIPLMYKEYMEDIWAVVDDFLVEEKFSFLSQRLLILLDEHELRAFLNTICKCLSTNMQVEDFGYPSFLLEVLLLSHNDCIPLDEFLLLNAVINQGRQILRLLGDEEHEEERRKVEELLRTSTNFSDADHWALIMEGIKMKQLVAIKWSGLQSLILHYILSKECKTKEYCESLFVMNKICFQKSEEYPLVSFNGVTKETVSEIDDADLFRDGHKKRRRSKKKRNSKRYGCDETNMDVLVEFESSYGSRESHSGGGSWLLSTDGYSCPWNMSDLPEHLSKHSFSSWMKWVFSK